MLVLFVASGYEIITDTYNYCPRDGFSIFDTYLKFGTVYIHYYENLQIGC